MFDGLARALSPPAAIKGSSRTFLTTDGSDERKLNLQANVYYNECAAFVGSVNHF